MSEIITGRKTIYFVVGLFLFINHTILCYGETNFGTLLSLKNKETLNKKIDGAMKVIEKKPEDKESLITLGIAYHNLATIGVKTAPIKSVEYLKKANKLYPDDAFILAVLGSSTTMIGKYSKEKVKEGRKYVNRGGIMIDKAVMMAPDNILVRMIRSNNSVGLPSFFGRKRYIKADLLHVDMLINKSPEKFRGNLKSEVYYNLGKVYDAEGDTSSAKKYFKKAVEVSPDSKWAEKAKGKL